MWNSDNKTNIDSCEMKGHISDVRIGGVHRPPLRAFLRHMFLGVFGDVAARRRYIWILVRRVVHQFCQSTSQIWWFCQSCRRLSHSGRSVFSVPISARTNIHREWTSSSWTTRITFFSGGEPCRWTISDLSIRYAICTIADIRLGIDEICSVGETGYYFLNTQIHSKRKTSSITP